MAYAHLFYKLKHTKVVDYTEPTPKTHLDYQYTLKPWLKNLLNLSMALTLFFTPITVVTFFAAATAIIGFGGAAYTINRLHQKIKLNLLKKLLKNKKRRPKARRKAPTRAHKKNPTVGYFDEIVYPWQEAFLKHGKTKTRDKDDEDEYYDVDAVIRKVLMRELEKSPNRPQQQ